MHKISILLLLIIATSVSSVIAMKPIVIVPPPPQNYEVYTDNEDIFFEKYLEYYIPAIMLQAQLKIVGVSNYPSIPSLSFQDIQNLDVQKLKNIVKVANNLMKQVEALPDTYNPLLVECEKNKMDLDRQLFKLSLDTIALFKEKKYTEMLKNKLSEVIAQAEKNEMLWNEKYQKLVEENFKLKYYGITDKEPTKVFIVNLITKGAQHFVNQNDIEKGVFPAMNINFEAVNIAQQRASISLWSEYSYQTTKVKINPTIPSNDRQHYIELVIAFGADVGLNISKLFKIKRVRWDFDLGIGYFYGVVNHANYNFPKTEYQGNILKVETSFNNYWRLMPFGLHFGAYFNRFSDDIVYFKDGPPAILKSSWRPSIYAGISFNLIQVYK